MTQEEIKRKRTESVLREVIPEALATLNDDRINALSVIEVVCSRGRSDAKVYLDKAFLTEEEQQEALRQLRKVSKYLQDHIKKMQGWYKTPNLTFEFDEQFEKVSRIEALFDQIAKERERKKGDDDAS
jgi:ribosome-binding factor A